jgi:Uma2 family endonuclease
MSNTPTTNKPLTLDEFLDLPETDRPYELIDGQAILKMSPKFFHSRLQKTLLLLLDRWSENKGRIELEWAVILKRKELDWVPVPDLTYISFDRLSVDWLQDEACPVAPELVIEIISPGQTFGELAEKATDYLIAGIDRVWIVDTKAQTITIFYTNNIPRTFRGDTVITDELLPGLEFSPQELFQRSGISH